MSLRKFSARSASLSGLASVKSLSSFLTWGVARMGSLSASSSMAAFFLAAANTCFASCCALELSALYFAPWSFHCSCSSASSSWKAAAVRASNSSGASSASDPCPCAPSPMQQVLSQHLGDLPSSWCRAQFPVQRGSCRWLCNRNVGRMLFVATPTSGPWCAAMPLPPMAMERLSALARESQSG